jgi:hypothetical protein
MAVVFGIEVSFDNTSHKFTSRNFIQELRNIYLNCFNETECGKRREMTIRGKIKVRNKRERMEGCKCKTEMKKDLKVLMNEDKKEIIFQEQKFLVTSPHIPHNQFYRINICRGVHIMSCNIKLYANFC